MENIKMLTLGSRFIIRLPVVRSGVAILSMLLIGATGGAFLIPNPMYYWPLVYLLIGFIFVYAVVGLAPINGARLLRAIVLIVGPPSLTLMLHSEEIEHFLVPLGVAVLAAGSYWLAPRIHDHEWRLIFRIVPPVGIVIYIIGMIFFRSESFTIETGARLTPFGAHPIVIGITAISLFMFGAASESRKYVFAVFIGCFGICALASARGAMLAIVSMMIVWVWIDLKKRRISALTNLLILAVPIAVLVLWPIVQSLGERLFTSLLSLNDPGRGFQSGFSGRTEIWEYFIQVWLNEPIFGAGTTANYTGNLPEHNLFLELLVVSGLVGLLGFMFVVVWVLRGVFYNRRISQPVARLAIMAVVGYLVSGLFEARATNIGNAMSVAFFFSIFAALGQSDPGRRASPARPRSARPSGPTVMPSAE